VFLFASLIFYPLGPPPRWFRATPLTNPITWQVLRSSSIRSDPENNKSIPRRWVSSGEAGRCMRENG